VNFSLKAEPKNPVSVEALDAQGAVIRKLEMKGHAGINRMSWDLRYEPPRLVALRTVAPANPHIWEEPRFRDADSRSITHWGTESAALGPIVAPGQYAVRLTVDGQSYTQPLTVVRDPRGPGSEADLGLSVQTQLRIREDISHASDTANQIEWLRKQLEVYQTMLRPDRKHEKEKAPLAEDGDEYDPEPSVAPPRALDAAEATRKAALLQAADELDKKLQSIERRLVSQALQNSDDKYFVEPYGVFLNLIWLNAEVGTGGGDVAGSADFAPTDAQLESLGRYEAEMGSVDSDYRTLATNELASFNHLLETSNVAPLAAVGAH
jgi:hypothetical protein